MSAYVSFDEAALVRAAKGWLGTPFHANSNERGKRGGVCCHLLVTAIYEECGWIVDNIPFGAPGHARFNSQSIMEAYLDKSPNFCRITTPHQPGDLLGFKIKGTIHHVAIALPDAQIVHVVFGASVLICPLADPTWGKRYAATWRPLVKAV